MHPSKWCTSGGAYSKSTSVQDWLSSASQLEDGSEHLIGDLIGHKERQTSLEMVQGSSIDGFQKQKLSNHDMLI